MHVLEVTQQLTNSGLIVAKYIDLSPHTLTQTLQDDDQIQSRMYAASSVLWSYPYLNTGWYANGADRCAQGLSIWIKPLH